MKILLKIWPALTPILLYVIWQFFIKRIINRILRKNYCAKNNNSQSNNKEKIIEGEFADIESEDFESKQNNEQAKNIFSLENKNFVRILYLSLILAIACVISFGF